MVKCRRRKTGDPKRTWLIREGAALLHVGEQTIHHLIQDDVVKPVRGKKKPHLLSDMHLFAISTREAFVNAGLRGDPVARIVEHLANLPQSELIAKFDAGQEVIRISLRGDEAPLHVAGGSPATTLTVDFDLCRFWLSFQESAEAFLELKRRQKAALETMLDAPLHEGATSRAEKEAATT